MTAHHANTFSVRNSDSELLSSFFFSKNALVQRNHRETNILRTNVRLQIYQGNIIFLSYDDQTFTTYIGRKFRCSCFTNIYAYQLSTCSIIISQFRCLSLGCWPGQSIQYIFSIKYISSCSLKSTVRNIL